MAYFHIYGRNRYSKNLVLVSRNMRSEDEARKELKELREASGHDYTYKLHRSLIPIP